MHADHFWTIQVTVPWGPPVHGGINIVTVGVQSLLRLRNATPAVAKAVSDVVVQGGRPRRDVRQRPPRAPGPPGSPKTHQAQLRVHT